jgi:hypothetical protein
MYSAFSFKPRRSDMPVKLLCVVCGSEFLVPPCRANTAKTCSNKCAISVRAKSRERKAVCVCVGCGKRFEVPKSHKDRRVYCSMDCKFKSPDSIRKRSERVTGDKNPMWKGGVTMHTRGYLYGYSPDHPYSSNGYVFQHRLVVERWLREEAPDSEYLVKHGVRLYLSPDFIVHHLDGIKDDNERGNLIITTTDVHVRIHHGYKPPEGSYWPPDAKIILGKSKV